MKSRDICAVACVAKPFCRILLMIMTPKYPTPSECLPHKLPLLGLAWIRSTPAAQTPYYFWLGFAVTL